jgi:hypothetical protein
MSSTVMELVDRGVPVYSFSSSELEQLHNRAWEEFGTGPRKQRVIKREYNLHQYIVAHGGFFTLNTMHAGSHAVHMVDIPLG